MSDAMRRVDILRAACCVAGVDGETSPVERKLLERISGKAGVGQASLGAMIERAETEEKYYAEQFRILEYDRKNTMQILFRVAAADGAIVPEEETVLKRLARRLRVPAAQFEIWHKEVIEQLDRKRGNA